MARQVQLQGFNKRYSGTHYIGRIAVAFQPEHLVRTCRPPIETYPKPSMKFVRDPDVESFETLSICSEGTSSKPSSLEYRITGVTWHTPRFVNTCNIDSFLSAWVRKMRQTHGKYLKHVISEDRVGAALYTIADHALCAKNKIDSEFIKGIWLIAVLKRTDEISVMKSPPIDCTGYNAYSVFQHLENHNR